MTSPINMTNHRSDRLTVTGKWAFAVALLFAFSISAEFRLSLFGLLVHPYLLLLPIAVFFGELRYYYLPNNVKVPLYFFVFFFSVGCLQNSNPFTEIFKVISALLTLVFFAISVRSEKDFHYLCWAFMICAFAIGIQGFLLGEEIKGGGRLEGINALEGLGNKNAQSLYTLPGIFFGMLLIQRSIKKRKFMVIGIVSIAIFFILVSVFLSANRSGWLGLFIILISFVFYIGVGVRSILLVCMFSMLSYFIIGRYASDIVEHKSEQTLEGYSSDVGRQRLATLAFKIGFENPIIGVGMDELHRQMAYQLGLNRLGVEKTDTHILWGYLFGATGIFSLLSFLFFLLSFTKQRFYHGLVETKPLHRTRILVIGFVILFVVRSLFSREILYSPTFMGGLGLIFGYYLFLIRSKHAPSL
ncbi:MAG: hypothetical protein KF763_02485 [Cyclobacteriaceae bacterium]|nr:hypothetical protein [Cyclobacteriaceae bacterium]